MPAWLLRGLCLGLLHAFAVVAVAKLTVFNPTDVDIAKAVSIALLVGAAALWSAIDGWLGRRDRGRNWFVAALIAGPVAGILSVVGRSLFVDQTGVAALDDALTGGAAFTALLVLVPAGLGLFAGSRFGGSRRSGGKRGDDEDVAGAAGTSSRSRHRSVASGTRTRGQGPARPSPTPRTRG